MTSILCGLLVILHLASTLAEGNVNEIEYENRITLDRSAPPYPSAPTVSEISLTTPPNIPLAREYGSPAREYGPPARDYGPPARDYGPPARDYGPPARDYGPPARDYGPPARDYGPPARDYGLPARQFGGPAEEYGPYPPSSYRNPPPTSPVEYGPPPPTAFGAPPFGPNFLPVDPLDVKARLNILLEVAVVGIVGVSIFVLTRHYVIPYLIYFARSLEEEEERSLKRQGLDSVTVRILRAVTRGVCLERISCQLGVEANNYTLTNAVISAMEDYDEDLPKLVNIFRDAALGQVESCEPYACRNPQSKTAPARWRRSLSGQHRKRK